jgi:hypothetical protein
MKLDVFERTGIDGPVGLFVDGENLPAWTAPEILRIAGGAAGLRVRRVYGHLPALAAWMAVPGFEPVHTGVAGGEQVKNAADVKMAVDAMEFALGDGGRTLVLASSDRDFTPLASMLRKLGRTVIGIGEEKTSESFRMACHHFEVVAVPSAGPVASPAADIDAAIRQAVERLGGAGAGCPVAALNGELARSHGFRISSLPDAADRTWRGYLANRPESYALDPKGPEAKVRLVG